MCSDSRYLMCFGCSGQSRVSQLVPFDIDQFQHPIGNPFAVCRRILLVVELVELLETAIRLDGFVWLLVLEAAFVLLLIGPDSVFTAA